jgi:ADP-ribosylglycohydrolase
LAVSIGGDSDTIAAITGSIAEAFYGIPKYIKSAALEYLPQEFIDVLSNFSQKKFKNYD